MRSRLGRRRGRPLLALLGVTVAAIAWVVFRNAAAPYTFAETLPAMIHDFGKSARVVSISVDPQGVRYVVIGRDGRVYAKHTGATSPSVLEDEVQQLLAMSPTAENMGFGRAWRRALQPRLNLAIPPPSIRKFPA